MTNIKQLSNKVGQVEIHLRLDIILYRISKSLKVKDVLPETITSDDTYLFLLCGSELRTTKWFFGEKKGKFGEVRYSTLKREMTDVYLNLSLEVFDLLN